MNPAIFFGALTTIYGMLFFFDRFFKSCMHYPYDAFLRNTGLTVKFMTLDWRTSALNRSLVRWGTAGNSCTRDFLIKSFTVGVFFTFLLLPIGIILLIITIFGGNNAGGSHSDGYVTKDSSQELKMEIMLPGINLPLEEIGFYIVTIIISTMLHELGHALAAVMEDVPVTGFGVRLYYCLPMAYTEFSSEQLNSLKWFRKLRILCAGIWHNFLLASFCYLLISTMHITTSPFYSYNQNIIITEISNKSPLSTKPSTDRGLQVGNIITQINDCTVNSEDSWYHCLKNTMQNRPGYCISSDFIRLNDQSIDISHHSPDGALQCCDAHNPKLCCFEYVGDISNDAPVEIPQHVCLDVRRTIEDAYDYCSGGVCQQGFCLRPLMRNSTTIMTIKRKSQRDVIYIGHPLDVTRTIRISAFMPKQSIFSSYWPDTYALLLKYNIVFSLGLALINALPCLGLDGAQIINTIIHSFLVNRVEERAKREFISTIITACGTLLFGLAMLKVLWLSALRHLF